MKAWKLFVFLLPVFLIGCMAKPPSQYTSTLQVGGKITTADSLQLMSQAVRTTFPSENVSGSCVEFKIKGRSVPTKFNGYRRGDYTKKMADVCFLVQGDQIIRSHNIYSSNIHLSKWFEEIISKQKEVESKYLQYAAIMLRQHHDLEVDKKNFNTKIDNINITCTDETNSVPKAIMDRFENSIKLQSEYPNIYIDSQWRIDRYKLDVTSNRPLNPYYSNYSDNIDFRVTGYKVNPIPDTFLAEDDNLSIIVSYKFNSGDISKISVTNKTTTFITLEAIAAYFNGDVMNNILKKTAQLAPKSVMTLKPYDLTPFFSRVSDQYVYGDNIDYGYSANYKLSDSVASKSLYKVDKLTAK